MQTHLMLVNEAINVFFCSHIWSLLLPRHSIFAIEAIIRITPALQQNLTFRITFYTKNMKQSCFSYENKTGFSLCFHKWVRNVYNKNLFIISNI